MLMPEKGDMSGLADHDAIGDCLTAATDGVVVALNVQPRARRSAVGGVHGSSLRIRVTAPPADGRANKAVVDLLAEELGLKRARLRLIAGASGRHKRVLVQGVTVEEVIARLSEHHAG